MKIKELRKEKKIKQTDMSKDLGISRITLWRIENEKQDNINLSLLKNIAKYLNVTMSALF